MPLRAKLRRLCGQESRYERRWGLQIRWQRAMNAAAVAAVVVIATGCAGGDDSTATPDEDPSPALPAALKQLDNGVLTRVRVVPASELGRAKLEMCERHLSVQLNDAASVVERTSPHGSTWTFLEPGGGQLDACIEIPHPYPDASRLPGDPWCSAVVGRLEAGQLTDPRLRFCTNEDGDLVGSAWIESEAEVEWIVIRDGKTRSIYRVAGQLPILIMTRAVDIQSSSATIPVDYYAADGRLLRSSTLHAAVAG